MKCTEPYAVYLNGQHVMLKGVSKLLLPQERQGLVCVLLPHDLLSSKLATERATGHPPVSPNE